MATNPDINKTLHVSVKNRRRLAVFGEYGDTWNDVIGRVLKAAEQNRTEPEDQEELDFV